LHNWQDLVLGTVDHLLDVVLPSLHALDGSMFSVVLSDRSGDLESVGRMSVRILWHQAQSSEKSSQGALWRCRRSVLF
jgi:hypothetical protein